MGGCAGGSDSGLLVDLRTDYLPGVEFAEVEVGLEGMSALLIHEAAREENYIRGVRVAELSELAGQVTLRVRLLAENGARLAENRVLVAAGASTGVTVVITRSCEAVTCPAAGASSEATQCVGGRCVPPDCTPEQPEACAQTCQRDADCPQPSATCALALCRDGTCFQGADLAACGSNAYCHPDFGCTQRLQEECGARCDTGRPCEVGIVECTEGPPECVAQGVALAGTICRAATDACDAQEVCDGESVECPVDRLLDEVECRAADGDCDLPERCDGSIAACPRDEFVQTGLACAQGFCDGLGGCSSGCSPGMPCAPGAACQLGTLECGGPEPTCMPAGNAVDGVPCGAPILGSWGGCGDFSNTCDVSGSRTRSVRELACAAGACQPIDRTQMEACSRNTDGVRCGVDVTGGWSACGGFANTCAVDGTQTRERRSPTCRMGSCDMDISTESTSCTRTTEGTPCGRVTYGPWSSCGGFGTVCDETGTETRDVYTPTCSGGSCGSVTTQETRPCSRSTAGLECGLREAPCVESFCQSGACLGRRDLCPSNLHCCEFGCVPNDSLCP